MATAAAMEDGLEISNPVDRYGSRFNQIESVVCMDFSKMNDLGGQVPCA